MSLLPAVGHLAQAVHDNAYVVIVPASPKTCMNETELNNRRQVGREITWRADKGGSGTLYKKSPHKTARSDAVQPLDQTQLCCTVLAG
jgi:hypothetical protein